MTTLHLGYALRAALLCGLLALGGCSSLGGAFGERPSAVAELPDVEVFASDEAMAQAKVHFRKSNFGYSAAYYKRAVELMPDDTHAMFGLAASYDRLHRFDLADRVYARILKLKGANLQYYNNVGYSQMLRGNLSAARANFAKAQALAPDNVTIANNLELLGAGNRSGGAI